MRESIAQQYFDTETTSPLRQCIYEEKETGDDREWFFFNDNWCYFETKDVRDKDEEEYNKTLSESKTAKPRYKTVHKLISKRHKSFAKTCSILNMSFSNYFMWQYCEFYNAIQLDDADMENLIQIYFKHKESTQNANIKEFFEHHEAQKREQQAKFEQEFKANTQNGCLGCTSIILIFVSFAVKPLWIITLPLIAFTVIRQRKNKKPNTP